MSYAEDVKLVIVLRYEKGETVAALCEEFGISRCTLYRWRKQYSTTVTTENRIITYQEFDQLRRTVKKQESIIKILKTVTCTATAPLRERLNELEKLYGLYDVHTLCEALDVNRGTFYNHIKRNKRDKAWFEVRREEYRILIQQIFDEYRQVLGAQKIHAILRERGHKISSRYVSELMREMGLSSIRTTAKADYEKIQKAEEKRQDKLQQQFHADKPNQAWVSDITYFRFGNGFLHICVILDLYSRKVISYKISKKMSTQLATSTFRQAYAERHPENGLIFHSDRGSQYVSYAFQKLLKDHHVIQSFSRVGTPHDNAVAESFFSTMKKEELYRRDYQSEKEFRKSVEDYIDFYNNKRPHRTLNNKTPLQFEAAFEK